jgi:hypothetical protein
MGQVKCPSQRVDRATTRSRTRRRRSRSMSIARRKTGQRWNGTTSKGAALESWLNGDDAPYNCARRSKSKFFSERTRRAAIRAEHAPEIALRSVGGASDAELPLFRREQENWLRQAVHEFCEESYRNSWGAHPRRRGADPRASRLRTGREPHVRTHRRDGHRRARCGRLCDYSNHSAEDMDARRWCGGESAAPGQLLGVRDLAPQLRRRFAALGADAPCRSVPDSRQARSGVGE